jgi:hypothetical protein
VLPDERLSNLLRSVDEQARPGAEFLDALFERLLVERAATRPAAWYARRTGPATWAVATVAAAILIAVAGVFLLGSRDLGPAATPSPAASPSASPSPSPERSAGPSIVALTDAQLAWCTIHTGGPGEDQHQVEDMALVFGFVPGARSRDDVFGRWAGRSFPDLALDPTFNAACRAAYTTLSSAAPAPSGSPDPLRVALNEFDHAVTAARGPLGISDPDQSRLFALEDGIIADLDGGDRVAARAKVDEMLVAIAGMEARLDTDGGRRLKAAVVALDGLLPG